MNYTIKEVSKKFKLTTYTLRYYEKEGLLPSIERDKIGNRIYSDPDLERVQFICCMRSTGMSISQIKQYVELFNQGEDTLLQRRQILLDQQKIIEEHIKEFKNHQKVINNKIKFYDEMISGEHDFNSIKL